VTPSNYRDDSRFVGRDDGHRSRIISADISPQLRALIGRDFSEVSAASRRRLVIELIPRSGDAHTTVDDTALHEVIRAGYEIRLRARPRHRFRTWLKRLLRSASENHVAVSLSVDLPAAPSDPLKIRIEQHGLKVTRDRHSPGVRIHLGTRSFDLPESLGPEEELSVEVNELLSDLESLLTPELTAENRALVVIYVTLMPFTRPFAVDLGALVLDRWDRWGIRLDVDIVS